MFDVVVSQEQLDYAQSMVDQYNFGQRGYGDGSKKEQLTGIIGQTVFADLLDLPRPNGAEGFDGGKDFVIHAKRVDIKTMTRKVPMRDYFVHNFVGYQKSYDVDFYIFASYNITNRHLTICGYIDKDTFFKRASYFEKGATRTRSDGTTFKTFAPLYEIEQKMLFPAPSLQDILINI